MTGEIRSGAAVTAETEQQWLRWFSARQWSPFPFQADMLRRYFAGESGILNAPTGSGKTYALGLPLLLHAIAGGYAQQKGLKALWITPIRALAPEICDALRTAANELGLKWRIENRTGDTSSKERERQKKDPPDVLLITPESLHILLSQKGYSAYFAGLRTVICDEWHELVGTKRGVQVELALSRLRTLAPGLRTWGISATVGNLEEASGVLMGTFDRNYCIVKADIEKKTEVISLLPDTMERLPWAGHLGIRLLDKVLPVLESSRSTLVFTNTRSQAEIWYQAILAARPDWAGLIALHHGSLSQETRHWVEAALDEGRLKVVVCTSSLDLGVDFRPVETVVQIGSPKGVSRFAQRAGRSGHQPGATSRIYILPTHALELVEAAAIREALRRGTYEERQPVIRAFDVLVQYLVTLAVSEGFREDELYEEVKKTFCYESITREEWMQVLVFITSGGPTLQAYEEYKRVKVEGGRFFVDDRRLAMRHRLSIGTIASDSSIRVSMMNGKNLGTMEEYFVSRLKPGDVFIFSGQLLELVQVRGMQALVRKASKRSSVVPSWQGGRMPLSSQVSALLREKLSDFSEGDISDPEMEMLIPLLELQRERSHLPGQHELLIEILHTSEGRHLFIYPFEGRLVHEGMAMLIAYRLSRHKPASFSLAMSDYGFEILTATDFRFEDYINAGLFRTDGLSDDLFASTNYSEIARRRFRDIASIAGLLFKGFPQRQQKTRHLQANSNLFYEVFSDYDKENLLLRQAFEEASSFQLEELRLREALQRIQQQELVLTVLQKPSPFCFPILTDSLSRERISNETVEDRVKRMLKEMEES